MSTTLVWINTHVFVTSAASVLVQLSNSPNSVIVAVPIGQQRLSSLDDIRWPPPPLTQIGHIQTKEPWTPHLPPALNTRSSPFRIHSAPPLPIRPLFLLSQVILYNPSSLKIHLLVCSSPSAGLGALGSSTTQLLRRAGLVLTIRSLEIRDRKGGQLSPQWRFTKDSLFVTLHSAKLKPTTIIDFQFILFIIANNKRQALHSSSRSEPACHCLSVVLSCQS